MDLNETKGAIDNEIREFRTYLSMVKYIEELNETDYEHDDLLDSFIEKNILTSFIIANKYAIKDISFELNEKEFWRIIIHSEFEINSVIKDFQNLKENFKYKDKIKPKIVKAIKGFLIILTTFTDRISENIDSPDDKIIDHLFGFIETQINEYKNIIQNEIEKFQKINEKTLIDQSTDEYETDGNIYKINDLAYKYNILRELGITEEIEKRLGYRNDPKIVGQIIASILGENKSGQLAKIHSQFAKNSSNDPIKSVKSKEFIKAFFNHYGLEINNLKLK